MASISAGRPADDGSPRYVVNYRDPEGRQRRKTFRRKAEAVAFRNTVEADKLRGTYLDVDAGKLSFRTYAEEWFISDVAVMRRTANPAQEPALGNECRPESVSPRSSMPIPAAVAVPHGRRSPSRIRQPSSANSRWRSRSVLSADDQPA